MIRPIILFVYLAFLIWHSYSYKKWSDESDKFKTNKFERCFRIFFYLPLSILLFKISFIFIYNIIRQKNFEVIPLTDYLSFMIVSLISFFSIFLFFDNIIRFRVIGRQGEIVFGIKYSIIYSFLLSLSIIVLIGGYYYINNLNNEILKNLMKIAGLFLTLLATSNSLGELLKKNKN